MSAFPRKAGVLENDDDVEPGRLTVTDIVSGPAHGEVIVNPNGATYYTPDRNYNGKDTFTYRACDGGTP